MLYSRLTACSPHRRADRPVGAQGLESAMAITLIRERPYAQHLRIK